MSDDWEAQAKSADPNRLTSADAIVYVFAAALLGALPVYLYVNVFGVTLDVLLPMITIVGSACVVGMAWSHHNVSRNMRNRMCRQLRGNNAAEMQSVRSKSLGLALANNNALFLILFLIFAFLGPIRSLAPTWNYAVSMLGASGVVLAASFG